MMGRIKDDLGKSILDHQHACRACSEMKEKERQTHQTMYTHCDTCYTTLPHPIPSQPHSISASVDNSSSGSNASACCAWPCWAA